MPGERSNVFIFISSSETELIWRDRAFGNDSVLRLVNMQNGNTSVNHWFFSRAEIANGDVMMNIISLKPTDAPFPKYLTSL